MSAHGSVRLARLGPPVTEIMLIGEIDLDVIPSARDLIGQVREAECPIHLYAHDLTFIDASGLRAVNELAGGNGRRAVLFYPPPVLRFLLSVTRLDQSFDVVTEADQQLHTPG